MARAWRWQVRVTVGLCVVMLLPASTRAWGREGHLIIASIATKHLSPRARRAVVQLLHGETLSNVAVWADDIRRERPETEQWHFVDIPLERRRYDPVRDCRPTPHGDCVIAAIARFRHVLADADRPSSERAEALRFLVHLIGDVHQPLHCADDHDRGGNAVEVTFFGQRVNPYTQKRWNLHAVWDSGIIDRAGQSVTRYARRLQDSLAAADLVTLERGTVVDWALEAHQAAGDHAYKTLPASKRLGAVYSRDNLPVIDDLLAKAGVRLAGVLNDAFSQ